MKYLKWLTLPFAWLFGFRKDAVIVHAYSPFIFTWPLIVLGFFFYPAIRYWHLSPDVAGWIYVTALLLVLLTMGIDINRNTTIFWIVLVVCVWFGLILLKERQFTLFSRMGLFLASLKPNWQPDAGLAISIVLTAFYLIVIGNAWLNDRWRFVAGEIEHWSFGRSDDSMGRGAKVISTSYPDILELLLFLSGTITIYNAQKTLVMARINRVPLLPFRVKAINRLLEAVPVTPATIEEDAAHDADMEHAESEQSAGAEAEDTSMH